MGEGWGEGKTTAPISDDPKTQGRLKSPANPNLVSGNRLKEYNGIEYTYDALGNLIYRQLPDGENQYYQYDLENQLVRAEIKKPAGNTEIWTYAYDPFGRRLSKERQDKLAWTSTEPKRTHFVWDGTRLLQEYTYKGSYTYIYTDQDSYEPLAQIFDNAKDGKQYIAYFHTDQVGIPREMTDIHGNLLWYGEYTAWGRLKKDERVYKNAHQPFRLQNQYFDEETGLHYNFFRYYEPDTGRFINQDPIGLAGGENLYWFAPNGQDWLDPLGLDRKPNHRLRSQRPNAMRDHHTVPQEMLKDEDFVAQLEQCGLKSKKARRQFIDQQIVRIDAKKHDDIHRRGWNQQWKTWFSNNPNFKLSDIMDQIQVMMKQHNIPRATRNYVRKYKRNGPTAFIIGKK